MTSTSSAQNVARVSAPAIAFGRPLRSLFPLEEGVTYLNHGTVGVTPRRVLARQQALRDAIERNPSRFLLRELTTEAFAGERAAERPRIAEALKVVAEFVGARPADIGFVSNATAGVNAVLRAIRFAPDDEIVLFDHTYGAVQYIAHHTARVKTIPMPFPVRDPRDVVTALEEGMTKRTRLVIVDHITSPSALVLPLKELVACARERGALVLVDGAHAPGAIPLNIEEIDADFYVANLHKWAWAPRSVGLLWARADRQRDLHAPILSWGLGKGLNAELEWQGTYDPTMALCAPEGIALMGELGLDDVRAWNHRLAWFASTQFSQRFDLPQSAPESMVGAMVAVPLPVAGDPRRVRDELYFNHGIEVHVTALSGRLWARISAQVYLDEDDVMRLLRAV